MKGSLERLIDEEESRVIMDLVNRVPSQVNSTTDTIINPVGSLGLSKPHSKTCDMVMICWYEGDHKKGVPNGEGTMTGQNGENAKGEWRNGELVKGTIRVYRNGQWRTYTMDSLTSHFQYLGGFGQPISGKGEMVVGKRACSGTFENGEMVMGSEFIESTKQGMKWDVRCVFAVNGEKATLRYSVLNSDEKLYDSLVCDSCVIVSKGNAIVESAFKKEGEKVTQTYQCTPPQLEQVFSEKNTTMDERFQSVQLVERKTERGEGSVTSHYYYWNHQTIDYLNGLVYNAASRVVYQGELAMSIEGAVTVPVRNGRGKEYVNGVKVFEGQFEYDRKNGEGMEIYGEYQLKGKWKNGVKDGEFVMNYKNELVFKTNYENGNNGDMWSVYEKKTLLYQGSLNGFLPKKGNYYAVLNGRSIPVSTDALNNRDEQTIDAKSAVYSGQFVVEDDFYCVVKGKGILCSRGWEYAGVFNTIDYISDCTVKSKGKEVFFGIVRGLQFYAGFHNGDYCTEEGLFENGSLKHGYKLLNGELSTVGDPSVYEKAYTSERMTFRNTRRSIKDLSESKDRLKSKGINKGGLVGSGESGYIEEEKKPIPVIIPLNSQTEKTNSEINAVNPDEDGASSQEQSKTAFPTHAGQSPANLSSDKPASEDASPKTVNSLSESGSFNLNPTIPLSEKQQVSTPDPQSEDTPTYTLTKNGDSYYLNYERVSAELEDNGATVIVPYNHNHEDNPATQIYLKFTNNGYTYTFVNTVIRMPSPLCSIKHPKSYSDACTRGPPDRRRPPHAERRSSPQGCTRPTQYPAFAHPCTP